MAQQPPPPPDDGGSPPPDAQPPGPPPSGSSRGDQPRQSATPPPTAWGPPELQLPAVGSDDATGYVRRNAGRYTREAVTARLVAAGHTPDAIATAWATVEAEDAAEGRRDRRRAVSTFIGAAYLLTWAVITAAWLVGNPDQALSVALVSGLFAFFLFLPGLLGFVLTRRSRRLARAGAGTAVAFAILPLLILVALAGTCVSIVPPTGFA